MLGLAAVPALIQLVGMLFIVPGSTSLDLQHQHFEESPRWLLDNDKKTSAEQILQKIRGPSANINR
jgi:hypothetical protein